jgi:tRNA(Ile)-lysidine synthase
MDLTPWMKQWNMLPPEGGTVLCAVSGGRDSVCLLHYLRSLAGIHFRVAAAHFNHQLRPTAQRDEEFVRDLCGRWGVPLYVGRGDVAGAAAANGWSREEAARYLRYDFLERTAEAIGAERIATAHHLEDQAETVLLHLIRGTGTEGLGGMPPVRGRVVRPLLQTPRDEIETYLEDHALTYVDDETNEEEQFARNRLRLRVWPELEQIHPSPARQIGRAAVILRAENTYLNELALARLPREGTELPAGDLLSAPEVLRPRMIRLLLARLPAGRKDFGAVHFEAVSELAASGGVLDLPGGVRAVCRGGMLRLEMRETALPETVLRPGRTDWGEYTICCRLRPENLSRDENAVFLNCDRMDDVVCVRTFTSADRLTLPGQRGSRSVKRLLADRGVPPERRLRIPVICVGKQVAAVYGLGTDMAFVPSDGDGVMEITINKRV